MAPVLLLSAVLWGCVTRTEPKKSFHRYEYAQLHMGVQVRLVVYAEDQTHAEAACTAAFGRIAALEDIFSDYRPDSELMRLCGRSGDGPVRVSDELFLVLQRAQELARQTEGAFDVTVGPLVQLWRQARKTKQLPRDDELTAARQKVGWHFIKLQSDTQTVELKQSGMRLDLGGIAKGYAGDEAIRVLKQHGIHSALFEAGGDIVVSNAPPQENGWSVEILSGADQRKAIHLTNAAVSTSGDTEQFIIIDGKRYSHVVDPHTGMGLTNRYIATVIAKDGITSDSLSTALTVLGPDRSAALIRSYDVRAHIHQVDNATNPRGVEQETTEKAESGE